MITNRKLIATRKRYEETTSSMTTYIKSFVDEYGATLTNWEKGFIRQLESKLKSFKIYLLLYTTTDELNFKNGVRLFTELLSNYEVILQLRIYKNSPEDYIVCCSLTPDEADYVSDFSLKVKGKLYTPYSKEAEALARKGVRISEQVRDRLALLAENNTYHPVEKWMRVREIKSKYRDWLGKTKVLYRKSRAHRGGCL